MSQLEILLGLPNIVATLGKPNYKTYQRKRGNKYRLTHEPNAAMRALHERFIELLGTLVIDFRNATGGLPGTSPQLNARLHKHNRHFYIFDIESAYQHVRIAKLAEILHGHADMRKRHGLTEDWGTRTDIEAFLKAYVAGKQGGLAEGLNASPLLFNIYAAETVDETIRKLSTEPGTVFTRYIDDVVISSPWQIASIFRRRVREAVECAGFTVSRRKSFVKDIYKGPITITGVVLGKGRRFTPKEKTFEKLESLLAEPRHNLVTEKRKVFEGLVAHLQSLEGDGLQPRARDLLARARQRLRALPNPPLRLAYGIDKKTQGRWTWDGLRRFKGCIKIETVIGNTLTLRKSGHGFKGLCPFHDEQTPSFHVHPVKQFYHCFGCGMHGDVISFVMEVKNLKFKGAVHYLAREYLGEDDPRTL